MRGLRRPITLRLRVALFSGVTLLSVTTALLLFINIVATVSAPNSQATGLPHIPTSQETPVASASASVDGGPTVTPIGMGTISPGSYSAPETDRIHQTVLGQLQVISAIGLLLVIFIGSVAAYWAAGQALSPLSRISRTAKSISATTLDTRLSLKAPDEELKELSEAFDTMLSRLQHSFTQQGQFVSNAAHELRNPLTTLRTNVEVAQLDPAATVEDYQEMAIVLENTLTRLETLVADLLLMARDEHALVHEDVPLEPLLQEVIADLMPLAKQYRVKLYFISNVEVDVCAWGDEALLARVFANLVENGIRYNRLEGTVSVTLRSDDMGSTIVVEDTGIGIPAEYQATIFERFYRLDRSRSKHRDGSGLGLSIVAHIVALHGGHIKIESAEGVGTKFTVSLPLKGAL